MMTKNNINLYNRLVEANTALDVKRILSEEGYWNDPCAWRPFADNENNYSQIGNQQGEPVAALVEKLINSIDATLMNVAQEREIAPGDKTCPQDMRQAVASFIENKNLPCGDRDGLIEYWDTERIRKESLNISIFATGKISQEGNPCLTISDRGEGQTPDSFPDTFLSLSKQNKLRIPYVQGKFNMGGTGVFRFCIGEDEQGAKLQLQLLLSKRNPKLLTPNASERDKSWGFTIVRRTEKDGYKSPVFEYLAPVSRVGLPDEQKGVLSFLADEMPIFPSDEKERPRPYAKYSSYGSLIKLYEYAVKQKTNLIMGGSGGGSLLTKLEEGLISCALPIQVAECRTQFSGRDRRSFVSELVGALTELGNMDEDKRRDRLELIDPIFGTLNTHNSALPVHVYVYKEDGESKRYNSKGVFFVINGQTHSKEEPRFFSTKKINLSYIKDSMFVIVDCTNLSPGIRSDVFMNSRDRMADGPFKDDVFDRLQSFLSENEQLQALNRKRQQERLQRGLKDEKPIEDTLRALVKSNPRLAELLPIGLRIPIPNNGQGVGDSPTGVFIGKKHPTFFRFKGNKNEIERVHPLNQSMRIGFETDVINNYFSRKLLPGDFQITFSGLKESSAISSTIGSLNDGVVTVVLDLDEKRVAIGDEFKIIFTVSDEILMDPFVNECKVKVSKPQISSPTGTSGRSISSTKNNMGSGGQQSVGLPSVIPVKRDSWLQEDFNEFSAMKIKQSPDGGYDFYYNADNQDLLNAQSKSVKSINTLDPQVLDHQYKIGLMLVSFALINQIRSTQDADPEVILKEGADVERIVEEVTRSISPYWLTIIEALGGQRFIAALSNN